MSFVDALDAIDGVDFAKLYTTVDGRPAFNVWLDVRVEDPASVLHDIDETRPAGFDATLSVRAGRPVLEYIPREDDHE